MDNSILAQKEKVLNEKQQKTQFILDFIQNHDIPNGVLNAIHDWLKGLESQFNQKAREGLNSNNGVSIESNDELNSIPRGSNIPHEDFNECLKKSFNESIEENTNQRVAGGSIGFPTNDPNSIERKKCTIVRDFMVGKNRMKENQIDSNSNQVGLDSNQLKDLESPSIEATSESVSGSLTIKLFVNGNVEDGVCELSLEGLETESMPNGKPNGIKKYEKRIERIEGYVHAFDETDEE